MEYQILKVKIEAGVALVTIARPEAMNALNSAFFREFNDFLNDAGKNSSIKVIVITGEGKSFVAGADIAELADFNYDKACGFSKTGKITFNRLEKMEMPIIAAVNGFALGGGCELALACDFRIASRDAKFGQPEVNLGLIPGYDGTQRLSRLAGIGNALFAILTGEMISADEAFSMGMVQKVVEPAQLMEYTMKIAKKMAANGSNAVIKAKEVIRRGYDKPMLDGSRLESEAFSRLFDYPSSKEGMKAFLEKRKPNW